MSVIPPEPLSRPQIAVSAAIFRDDKILLVRRARSPAKGFYSLPGGRVEFGETLHAALHREIDEETSLKIEIVDLAGWREAPPVRGRVSLATRRVEAADLDLPLGV